MTFNSRNRYEKKHPPYAFFILYIIVSLFASKSYSQVEGALSVLSGSVLDADNGGVVSGASIRVVGTSVVGSSDLKGRYTLRSLEEGTYTVMVTADFYKTSRIEEIIVKANEPTLLNIPLYNDDGDIVELATYTVKASVLENSEIGLLASRQKSPSVGDAMGSEAFSRLGLSDAADAMSKMTGTSVVDGQYIVVRGLSDRYNNATLNGTSIPSADPYRKAVQLDQFPAGLIDVITTTKTATPDKPGNFTGGAVNIETKSFPSRFFFNVASGVSFNSNTYGKDFLTYTGGGDDWLAKDDGSRALPEAAVDVKNLATLDPEVQDEIVHAFSPEVSPRTEKGKFSQNHSISVGDSLNVGEKVFGYVASLTYKRSYSADSDSEENRYRTLRRGSAGEWQLYRERELLRDVGEEEVNIGFTFNAAVQLNDRNEIGVKGFFNRSGIDEAAFIDGKFDDSDEFFLRENRLHYTERAIDSILLYGDHEVDLFGGMTVEWSASDSTSSQDEPDFRLFYDAISLSDLDDPQPGSYFFPTGLRNWRLFRELTETSKDYSLDITKPLNFEALQKSSLKLGYNMIKGERDYFEQTFGYRTGSPVSYDGIPENYLSEENIGLQEDGRLGRVISTETTQIPRYTGTSDVEAYYLMLDLTWNDKLRTIFGARQENTDIGVATFDFLDKQTTNGSGGILVDDLLPSANVVWTLKKDMNLRFAFSKTLARPNYRELSPIPTFTAIGGFSVVGNAELERTLIDNLDLRWEWFREAGQVITVGVFQKELKDPIEQSFSTSAQTTYLNVAEATVRGVEFEARHNFTRFTGENSRFSVGGNLAFIDSKVTRSENELSAKRIFDPEVSETRELQGQSPYIFNVDASYEHFTKGLAVTLTYNSIGERLYEVSLAQLPDVYEQAGDSLDLIVTKRFGDAWKVKFKAGNLLDEEKLRYHSFLGEDIIYSRSSSGKSYSFGFSHDFR